LLTTVKVTGKEMFEACFVNLQNEETDLQSPTNIKAELINKNFPLEDPLRVTRCLQQVKVLS